MVRGEVFSLLATRRFLPLFLCQFIAAFGDHLIRTTLITYIAFEADHLSEFTRSLLSTMAIALFVLPYIFLSSISGQLADKFDKARLIQVIRLVGIGFTLIGVASIYSSNYVIMLFAIFLAGLEATIFGSVKYSILADHLERDELIAGNGLVEAGTFLAVLFGIISGVVISSKTFEVTSIILLMVSISSYLASLFILKTQAASPKLKFKWNIFSEMVACMNYAKREYDIFLAILGISWLWVIGGLFIAEMPNFTRYVLNGENSVYLLLLSLFSVGIGAGSIVCNKILKNKIDVQYVPTSLLLMTVSLFLLWYSSIYFPERSHLGGIHYFLSSLRGWAICLEVFAVAFFGGIYVVPLYALIQARAKKTHRSRIIAANNIYNSIFMVVGTLICMVILGIGVNVSYIILLLAVTNFFTAVYICRLLPDTVIKSFLQAVFKILYRVEIVGMENYHKAGKRILIIANHASFIDPGLLGAFLPDRLVFAIYRTYAESFWLKPFLTYLRAYPIDPTNAMSAKTLIEKLKEDKPVVIFPEGRITVTGSLMKIYEGPGLVADKANATLLPIRIDGAQYSPFSRLYGKTKLKLFPKIKITIMEPQKIEVPSELVGRERRHEIGKCLYDIMSKMMFEGSEYHSTLFESLIEAKSQFGKQKIIVEDVEYNKLTYKRILTGSFILGKKIAQVIPRGKFVGVLLPNTAATTVVFFACMAFGRVPAMLNFSTGVRNIVLSCQGAKITTVYTSRRFVEKANFFNIVQALNENHIDVIYLEDVRMHINILDKILGLLVTYFPMKYYKRINKKGGRLADNPAVVLFTSGSEGVPKGVVLSHKNIQANIKQAASRVDFSSSDIVFNALPVFHSFGLTGGFLLPVLSGVRTFFYPSPLHYRIIPEMVYGSNATIMFGTDTFLSGYAKYAHPYDFFSIRYIFAGAEKLRDETRKTYMEKFGIRVFEGYGATEASPIISVNTPMHYKSGTVGRILPNIDYFLEPVAGISKGGRFIISGPNIMLGYMKSTNPGILEKPEYTINGKTETGWYDTGDIVDIDKDQYITILGRVKRFAKIGGEMISLSAVEEAIAKIWQGFAHAVVNMPNDHKGEVLVLFTTNPQAKKDELIKQIKLLGYTELFAPKIISVRSELPVLSTGKTDYVTLKEMAMELKELQESDESEELGD